MLFYFSKFFERIAKDFRQKELLPLKVLFFVHMSTLLVLYPYLTIHMRELGINVKETAIMSAVTPVVGLLMPPLAGLLADKIGNFRLMLALFSVFSGVSALLLLLVPVGRATITFPDNVVLGMSCGSDVPLSFTVSDDYPCSAKTTQLSFETDIKVQSCGFICEAHLHANDSEAILRSTFYDVQMHDIDEQKIATTTSVRYTVDPTKAVVTEFTGQETMHKKYSNKEYYKSAIRKFFGNSYYFPAQVFKFGCDIDGDNSKGDFNCVFGTNVPREMTSKKNFTAGLLYNKLPAEELYEHKISYDVLYITDSTGEQHNATCQKENWERKDYITIRLALNDLNETIYKNVDLGSCAPRCIATAKRSDICTNSTTVLELDVDFTFWCYLGVRVFVGIIGGTAYTMFEGAVIAILREFKADYGLQRMYASFGGMISSPLSGLLIDYASRDKSYTDFRPIFFLYAGMKITSAFLMLLINLEFKKPASSVISDVLAIMNIELVSLFVATFLLGCSWGYIESFLFWLLQDLGGTKSLMGLTVTVGGILGIPLLALSGPIIKKVGHANIIFIGFLTYAVRLFGYSIIYNPWLSLIFEALECLTHSLCFTAAITYAARLSTSTTDTTIQGILGGLFYAVGKSAGSLVGGYLIKYCGMRETFQIFAAVSALTGFIYLGFYHVYMKKRSTMNNDLEVKTCDEKNSNDMKEIARAKAIEDIVDKPKAVPYEDSLTNLGFEDVEFDATKESDHKEQKDEKVPNV